MPAGTCRTSIQLPPIRGLLKLQREMVGPAVGVDDGDGVGAGLGFAVGDADGGCVGITVGGTEGRLVGL